MNRIKLDITGNDVDKIDAESLAEYVYASLRNNGYDVTVIGYEDVLGESAKSALDDMDNAVNEFFGEVEHIVNNGTMNITL